MKILLTSGGVRNPSIHNALLDLLGKPISECNALCIPTAVYGHPWCSPNTAWDFITGKFEMGMCELNWKSLGVLELTALPSIDKDRWTKWVRDADILLVDGGDALYLAYWMRESGLADLLPSLTDKVWVGVSAGSMALTPRIGEQFESWKSPEGNDSPLGIVPFSIFPHLDYPDFPDNAMPYAEKWASEMGHLCYAIDDQTAIKVTGGGANVEVVSEGHWRQFNA